MIQIVKSALTYTAATGLSFAVMLTSTPGCSVALHGRVATWAATYQHEPPDVPNWGTPGHNRSTTRPANGIHK